MIFVGKDDLRRELEVGERFDQSAPVVLDAFEPRDLTVGRIVVDNVFGEEVAEVVEFARRGYFVAGR